jgi:hypothetical protein
VSVAEPRPPFEVPSDGIADGNDRFWQPAPSAVPESIPGQPAPAPQGGPVECLLLGPTQVGKTSLVMAVERACALPTPGEPDLLFVPEEQTALLIRRAVRLMINPGESHRATRDPAEYRFSIRTEERQGPRELRFPEAVRMALLDGPGGALFPSETDDRIRPQAMRHWEDEMVAAARGARSLILCVNAVAPRSDRWQEHLPVLISRMIQPVTMESERKRSFLRRERRPAAEEGRTVDALPARRVLLLITKTDQLCAEVIRGLTTGAADVQAGDPRRRLLEDLASLSPAALAATLDPIAQARALLGLPMLNQIRHALRRDAVFAVGLCSSGGFDPTSGEPYWTPDGKPLHMGAETEEEILRRWVPYGVRDAIFFIATGRVRGTVQRILRQDLIFDNRAMPVDVARADIVSDP